MAKGKFNLNQLLSGTSLNVTKPDAGAAETPRRVPLKVVSISVYELVPSNENFYSADNIVDLKMSIEMFGVKQNLTVKSLDNGKYEVIAGHRRRLACLALVAEGKTEFEYVPCGIETERDAIKEKILLIMTNSTTRQLSDWEKMKQAEELRRHFEELKKRDNLPGRVRDMVAEALNTSATQVARMDAISNNLTDEFKNEMKDGRLGVSTAYELSGLPHEEQREAYQDYSERGGISLNDVRALREDTKRADEKPPAVTPIVNGPGPVEKMAVEKDESDKGQADDDYGDFDNDDYDDEAEQDEKRDFADMSNAEKADSAIALLNYYRFTIFQPGEDTRLFDFIVDVIDDYRIANLSK